MRIVFCLSLFTSLFFALLLANEPSPIGAAQLAEIRGGCYKTEQQNCPTPADLNFSSCGQGPSCNAFAEGANCTQNASQGWYQWNSSWNEAKVVAVGLNSSSVWETDFCVVQKQCRCHSAFNVWLCVTQAAGFGETNLQWYFDFIPSTAVGYACPGT